MNDWPFFERNGFLSLRRLPGRHIILKLANPANELHSMAITNFNNDQTLELLAVYDMAQVYQLMRPVPVAAIIPGGDASKDLYIGMTSQLREIQKASASQSESWEKKRLEDARTGGKTEDLLETLLNDVVQDASGSYDLLVRPATACKAGYFYNIVITSKRPGAQIIAPASIQFIPESP
ncbi:MAG: hypothetical protein ABI380_07445 [Edaphobacter sp.]